VVVKSDLLFIYVMVIVEYVWFNIDSLIVWVIGIGVSWELLLV